ncbi:MULTISPECIES: CYTH domain-containing protein [Methylocaldum]|jgi:adenylate cyclase|uniref:CYTH domain-containing protein n=1 Tax=unclassified Methylocaldum TaxID=2622260 RepID=UPI00098B2114|nr:MULTISPECIES: CYTH domain-containing protein [unclassified Methylocaldum]MBP1150244.1 adenylate cyclase [Methylocaldum sp. RMAD-M]MDV3241209.1 CYTH domain-containing protein [Methylocaldum sp.]MVF23381.1 CYTH domain-containing protein [Methylocaldum sp. BRCS4]
MALEIERKFLVLNDSWRNSVRDSAYFRQGYLNNEIHCSVRVRVCGDRAWLNIKSVTIGTQRQEFEYEIPANDAHTMLSTLSRRPLIEKTRYFVDVGPHTWEIDVFEGDNTGLVVAEIELGNPDETFEKPGWLGEEVTYDPRYYNTSLSTNPYNSWQD